jgi:hypothetical protein
MTNLLDSLKSDLLDRRLLPLLVALGLALAGAVAYAVLGGGSGTGGAPSTALVPAGRGAAGASSAGSSLAVSQAAADPHAAVAETTEGSRYQHQSGAHNPFKPIVSGKVSSPKAASASSASATNSSAAGSTSTTTPSSGTGSATPGGGGTTPTQPTEPAPSKPAKPAHVYFVDVLFGLAPTTPGQFSQLTPYAHLKRLEPLPSVSEPRVIFAGVSDTGRGAVFALAGEAILKGEGACLPSATQCEALDLGVGKSEELDYLQASGQTVAYELQVVSISVHQASAAAAARLNRRDRKGQALLRHLSTPVLHHLHFSSAKGVLVYVTHHGG